MNPDMAAVVPANLIASTSDHADGLNLVMIDDVPPREAEASELIAPDGDMILIVGPSKRRLRVHSLFIKNASKVFAAMLSSGFVEGDSLRRRLDLDGGMGTAADPCEVCLPDDDADGMSILCRVVHGRTGDVPGGRGPAMFKLLPRQVLEVAIAADKYDCVEPLAFAVEHWVGKAAVEGLTGAAPTPSSMEDTWDVMTAAYWFNHEQAFRDLSLALMMGHRGSFLAFADRSPHSLVLSLQLCALLEERRSKVRADLAQILLDPVQGMGAQCCPCGYMARNAMQHWNHLRDSKFALLPRDLSNKSVAEAVAQAGELPNPLAKAGTCKDFKLHQQPNYKAAIRKELARFKSEQVGLCLKCVRWRKGCGKHDKA